MNGTENYRPLQEHVQYRAQDGSWHRKFSDALAHSGGDLTWDPAGLLSMVSFGYPCDGRTLISEIPRQPWMSTIGTDGEPKLQAIPPHDTFFKSHEELAGDFARLLRQELIEACKGYKKIYLTLSGGMDSRIMAAAVCHAANAGEIDAEITAVTWSWAAENSRDVVYGRKAAEILGINWICVEYKPEHLIQNIELSASHLACLVPGIHMHRMPWLMENAPSDALVIAASFGDQVGRADFMDRHLLELDYLRPSDTYGLLKPEILPGAHQLLGADLKALHDRTPGRPKYVLCEHEMFAHYCRGWCAQAMNIVTFNCGLHQVMTSPQVCSYVWSIHPSLRTDHMYAGTLELLYPKLARLPWSHTNRALMGKTEGAVGGLPREDPRQCYDWISGVLYDELRDRLDINWFCNSDVFDGESVSKLCERIRTVTLDYDAWDRFVWLVSFRLFVRHLEEMGKTVEAGKAATAGGPVELPPQTERPPMSRSRLWLRSTSLGKYLKTKRDRSNQRRVQRQALKEFPLKKS